MVTFERHTPAGMPATLRIWCVEPGEVMPGISENDDNAWIGLAPGQGLRVYLEEAGGRVKLLLKR